MTPEPWFSSLPGIDRAQALRQGLIGRPPLARLMGLTVTQVSPGAATMMLRSSPWLDLGAAMDTMILGEVALSTAVLTGAPAGTDVRTASLSVTLFRPPTFVVNLIAHARTLTSAPRFTFAEVAIEDDRGRAMSRATGASLVQPRDPPPPPAPPLGPVDEPTYSTPDPPVRPLSAGVQSVPAEYWERFDGMTVVKKLAGAEAPPLFRMLGLGDADAMYIAATGAGHTLSPAGYRPGALNMTYSFVRPVVPDGRTLDISGRATEQHEDLVLASATVADGEGRSLATLHETSLVLPVRSRPQPTAESMLATVVFTDLVGSTARLSALGDERWQTLLAETSGGRPAAPGSFPRPGGQDHRRPPATPERRRATRSLSAPPSPPTCRAGTWPGPGR